MAALELEDHAHTDTLYELFGTGSCRDFCRTLAWWCRGDASGKAEFPLLLVRHRINGRQGFVGGRRVIRRAPEERARRPLCFARTPPPYHLCAKGTITWRKFDGWARTLSDEQVWSCLPLSVVSQPDTERAWSSSIGTRVVQETSIT